MLENLKVLPEDMVEPGVDILARAGETKYAASLAKDRGLIDEAIQIQADAGDFSGLTPCESLPYLPYNSINNIYILK